MKRTERSALARQAARLPEAEPADGWVATAATLAGQNDLAGAAAAYRMALSLDSAHAAGFGGLAEVLRRQGLIAEALDHCKRAVDLSRDMPLASVYLTAGQILSRLGRHDEAVAALTSAIALDPRDPEAHVALGLAFEDLGKPLDAFGAYQKSLALRPNDARVYNNLAAVLIGLQQFDLAIASGRAAVSLAPDHPDVYLNLATALRLRGDDDEALATYRTIIALKPDHGEALVELCHRRQHACDWTGLHDQQEAAWANSYRQGRLVSPFIVMTATDSPIEQLRCARIWGQRFARRAGAPLAPYAAPRIASSRQRLRLGYLSADFHSHATAMLLADLLEQHDRSRFELFAYSLGPDDGSALRRRLIDAFDAFVDLRNCSDAQAANRIHKDGIDVLLDLKGYTQNARVAILAHRPAPIQINYLGFPGTMGAPFIDYIIADPHVAPMAHQAFFDEKIVHLPHCYQPNDRKRVVAATDPGRSAYGLPASGFVFCSFNAPYKITSDMFDIWMRLLAATPGSVLWLLDPKGSAAANLRHEAHRRGIDPDRLVFAPFVDAPHHLARLGIADLFLDTFPVNAHTTAGEALWVGLPMVTCMGNTFASRVAGSLLHAIDMPDLVTASLADYEASSAELAQDPLRLSDVRNRLCKNRDATPLFDTPRYARNFERALLRIGAHRDAGHPPEAFAVSDAD